MRKLYKAFFLFCLLLVVKGSGQAQSVRGIAGWFNTHDFVENNAAPLYINTGVEFLGADSNAIWLDSAGNSRQFETYGAGHVFDLLHENWAAVPSDPSNPIQPISMGCIFYWDSLRFNYLYYRDSTDTQTVDTLIITSYLNSPKGDKTINADYFAVTDSEYCKMSFPNTYNYYNQSGGKYHKKDTILLTAKDIATIKQRKRISIPVQTFVGDGVKYQNFYSRSLVELIGNSIVFKSGYNYSHGDTVYNFKNAKAVKGGLFGVYTSSINKKGARNLFTSYYTENSIWLSKNNRYGGYEKGFFGFVPGMLYPQVKYFDCEVFVSANCVVSVPEINKAADAQITSIFPNPVAKNDALTLTLHSKEAANYTVSVKDILGQTVCSANIFCDSDSNTNIELKLPSSLLLGVYYITLIETTTQSPIDVKKIILTQ